MNLSYNILRWESNVFALFLNIPLDLEYTNLGLEIRNPNIEIFTLLSNFTKVDDFTLPGWIVMHRARG
jgi:hypothetical protein